MCRRRTLKHGSRNIWAVRPKRNDKPAVFLRDRACQLIVGSNHKVPGALAIVGRGAIVSVKWMGLERSAGRGVTMPADNLHRTGGERPPDARPAACDLLAFVAANDQAVEIADNVRRRFPPRLPMANFNGSEPRASTSADQQIF